jgi:two-component system phosphate regulon sensor histidine kinase PhoR
LKNIKRIQNQLNYLSEYAKKLAKKESADTPQEVIDNSVKQIAEKIDEVSEYIKSSDNSKLTKNDIGRIELEAVTNSMSEGLIIYSMDLEVVLINPALAQMLLPSNPRGTGRLILNPDDRLFFERVHNLKLMEKIQRALIEEPTVPRSDILELKNPKQVLKRYSSPLYDKKQHQIGHVIIYHDITAETEIEDLRKDFISNASHELRTPVTSIKVLLESLMSGAKDEPKLLDEFLNDLVLEVDRLHQLVNDLLDIAKLEADKNSVQVSEFEIYNLIMEALSTIQPLAKSKDIILNYPKVREALVIRADRRKLRQVFVNLVINGVKFTPSGGEVSLSVNQLDDAFEFKVCDTGIGIPEEDQGHIFDKFYRVNKERSRVIGGSGLGLTIVKQIIEAHNGNIHVESEPGNTVFTFRIPQ